MKIGFFGLGHMGGPMSARLVKAGHEVRAYDLVPALVAGAEAAGAIAGSSVADTCKGAGIIISMLPSGAAVEALYRGEAGVLTSAPTDALLIDCSTIDAPTARRVAAAASDSGRSMLDAPVSGGVAGATAGTLTFICGGSAEAMARAEPVLLAMGRKVFHAGDHGAGQSAKICNNMLLAIHMIGTCEALQLGVDNGLDPKILSEIMLASSGRNWSLELYNPWPGVMDNVPAAREYEGGFAVDLMNKDLRLAMEAGMQGGSSTPLGALAKSLYAQHGRHGNGKLDFSSILKMFERKSDT